ncbi:uncharacterized protein LOC143983908 isoform X2 [Lithobates pipiens]
MPSLITRTHISCFLSAVLEVSRVYSLYSKSYVGDTKSSWVFTISNSLSLPHHSTPSSRLQTRDISVLEAQGEAGLPPVYLPLGRDSDPVDQDKKHSSYRTMGSSHSVIRGSKQREDISYSDIECKHGKIWNTLAPRDDHLCITSVFRFCLFMGVSCNKMKNDEEQSPVAVRLPKNCLFLLKQFKIWIANNFNARYSIVLQIEKQGPLYQGANRFQMLPWDAHEPPPKRVTRDGGWYILSMKVLKDEMDLGEQCTDNPDVHLKVILHIANRMTWTPPVVNPCFLNYHVDNTLSSEELCQLVRIQPEDTRTLIPGLVEFNHGAIQLDCRTLNIALNTCNLNTFLHSSYNKSDYNLIFLNPVSSTINPNPPWFNNEAIHEDHQDVNADRKFKSCPTYTNIKAEDTRTLVSGEPKFNHHAHLDYQNLNISSNPHTVLHSSCYKSGLNFPNTVTSTIIPNPPWFNNEAIHEDHQYVNANRDSKKCPCSTKTKAGNWAAPGFNAVCIVLLLTPSAAAYPVSQDHRVEIKMLRDSDNLNCTINIDNKYFLCYGHCDQNLIHHQHISDDTVEKLLGKVCKQNEKAMEMNQISLGKKHSLSSGTLQLIFLWERFNNAMNETIQCLFNYKKLTDEEMTDLPMNFPYFLNSDPNSTEYMERMKYYFKELWESSREKIIDDQPGETSFNHLQYKNDIYDEVLQ